MTFEIPEELLSKVRAVSLGMARELEARYVLIVDKAYREGWADGYLARMNEEVKDNEAN